MVTLQTLHFTKMHGLGNDFVILDSITQNLKIDSPFIRKIADRHFGLGCDQVLIIEPPNEPQYDFNYRIFNGDGKEVAQCGNGARCIGRYIYDHGLSDKTQLSVSTLAGCLTIDLSDLTAIEVNLGIPQFTPEAIPIIKEALEPLPLTAKYRLTMQDTEREVTLLSLGNPHCVITVPSTSEAAVQEIGEALQHHPAFPKGVNVTFMQVLARNHVKCRVYERGTGETLACGSGACAAVITGILQKELNPEVKVDMLGGALTVRWDGQNSVYLRGPVVRVFHGEFSVTHREPIY